jgi:hypothetical protein
LSRYAFSDGGVFLSYARKDGEPQAADLRNRLKRKAPPTSSSNGAATCSKAASAELDENSPAIKKRKVCESRQTLRLKTNLPRVAFT